MNLIYLLIIISLLCTGTFHLQAAQHIYDENGRKTDQCKRALIRKKNSKEKLYVAVMPTKALHAVSCTSQSKLLWVSEALQLDTLYEWLINGRKHEHLMSHLEYGNKKELERNLFVTWILFMYTFLKCWLD